MKWLIFTRGRIPPYRVSIIWAIHKFASNLNYSPIFRVLAINEGSDFWWAWNEKEIKELGNLIIQKCSDKEEMARHINEIKKYTQKAIDMAKKVIKLDVKEKTDQEIIDLYDFLYKDVGPAHALNGPDIDTIDVVFEDFLKEKLRKELKEDISDGEFLELYRELSNPIYQSYVSKMEEDIIKIVLKKDKSFDNIDSLYNTYWWVKLGWENMIPYDKVYFEEVVKKYSKEKNLEQKLENIQNFSQKTKQKRKELIEKYNLSDNISYWLDFMDKYNWLHDLRKEMQVKTTYSFHLLLLEVARRLKIDIDDLELFLHSEIKEFLRGKEIDFKEIVKRKKSVYIESSKKELKVLNGEEAILARKKELEEKNEDIKEIKGNGVTKGKVRGIVKVCAGLKEVSEKIRKGDILVCGMTMPDYVPVMKKASAIITNEGGITCHASIVAREMRKPCIIGTKIATKVLKDGDLVEVDATHGKVTIIEDK